MKRILAATAGLVLPVLFGVVTATPAAAAAQDCPADTFCIYPNSGYGGGQYTAKPTTACISQFVAGINNNANSMRNYRNHYVKLWDFPGCAFSASYTAKPLSYDNNFDNNKFTDKASSMQRV